jgi:hypothetical protein
MEKALSMPSGLRRFQQCGEMHFVTFSCYRRQAKLAASEARRVFERSLEQTRRVYGFCVTGYESPSKLPLHHFCDIVSSPSVCGKPMHSRMKNEENIVGRICSLNNEKC